MLEGWEGSYRLGGVDDVINVEVNNVLTEKRINNVFGVIKGFVDPGTVRCLCNKMETLIMNLVY